MCRCKKAAQWCDISLARCHESSTSSWLWVECTHFPSCSPSTRHKPCRANAGWRSEHRSWCLYEDFEEQFDARFGVSFQGFFDYWCWPKNEKDFLHEIFTWNCNWFWLTHLHSDIFKIHIVTISKIKRKRVYHHRLGFSILKLFTGFLETKRNSDFHKWRKNKKSNFMMRRSAVHIFLCLRWIISLHW